MVALNTRRTLPKKKKVEALNADKTGAVDKSPLILRDQSVTPRCEHCGRRRTRDFTKPCALCGQMRGY